MPILSQNISMTRDADFQKCGEIMVSSKRNTFAMSCLHCEAIFTRLPAFMRHLHQRHKEELQFEDKDAAVEVYAVEELVNRTLCSVEGDSEESGVVDEDFNMSEYDEEEEHNVRIINLNKKGKTKVNGKKRIPVRNLVKEATLGNMSILNALEDCDVSLDFVENLDNTIVERQEDQMESKIDECKKKPTKENECQENDEEDIDMDSTLLKRIQTDLDMENDEDQCETTNDDVRKSSSKNDVTEDTVRKDDCNSFAEDEDQNVTLTEHNISKSLKAPCITRATGLKNLLSRLDDLDDVDDLLDNIEDSMTFKHQEEFQQGTEENDADLDEINLNASILRQCLADDYDDDDENEGKDEKQTKKDKNDKQEETEISQMSDLHLKVMSDWGLDDIELEDCLNSRAFVSSVAAKTNEAIKSDNKSQVATISPKECKAVTGKPKTPKTKDTSLEYVTTRENTNMANARYGQLNTSRSPNFSKVTPKSSRIINNHKTTPFQKTLKLQNKSFSKQEVAALEGNVTDAVEVDETLKTEKNRGEPKAVASSTKSFQNTPKSAKSLKKCDKITKRRMSVPVRNECKDTEFMVGNKSFIENIKIEPLRKPNVVGKDDKTTTLNARIKTKNAIGEEEKELEKNKFEDGLSEDKSSTRMYEESAESAEKSKGYSLQSLLNKNLDDEDLDTLINQLETNVEESVEDTNENSRAKENENKQNQDTEQQGNDESLLEDEMVIFRKFIGLNSEKTQEEEEQFNGNDEEDADDFENLLNEDLSKALEKALGEDNADLLKLDEDGNEEKKIPTPFQYEMEKSHPQKKILSKICLKPNGQEKFVGKYSKTNQRARNVQGKPVNALGNQQKQSTHNVLALQLVNQSNSGGLPPQKRVRLVTKDNHEATLQQKLYEASSKSVQSPKKSKENQENSPANTNFRNNFKAHLVGEQQQQVRQVQIIKIKKEIPTPSRCFINMQRGERTPMKLNDLFMKQSPRTQEKTGEKPANILTQITPDNKTYKKSPSECTKNLSETTSPKERKTPTTAKMSPPYNAVIKQTGNTSPQVLVVRPQDSPRTEVQTPVKLRNLSIKLQRCPSYLDAHKSSENLTSPKDFKSPPTKQQIPSCETSPLSSLERANLSSVFKLPSGITISKVTSPTRIEVTPSKSNYCKQNFTEHQVAGLPKPISTESLIKSLPTSLTVTKTSLSLALRLRARQASIDIVPSGKSPKKCGLDYKSYAVNRSARKKEVLQRMRTIKKKIFKSMESNSLVDPKLVKSPLLKKKKRSVIQIENVQIFPNTAVTPLVNGHNSSPQLSSAQDVLGETTPKIIMDGTIESSPKPIEEAPTARTTKHNKEGKSTETTRTKDIKEDKSPGCTEMHGKKLKSRETTPKSTKKAKSPGSAKSPKSPLNQMTKEEDILLTPPKNSMKAARTPSTGRRGRPAKRRAPSPPEEEACPKKIQKSPTKQETCAKATELEVNQLNLSEGSVDFPRCNLKANRLNVESIPNEPMPVDDISADKTPQNTPEKKKSPKRKYRKTDEDKQNDEVCNNASDTNILDDLLEQVTSEDTPDANKNPKKNEMTNPKYKTIEDYNEAKDLELLEIVGLKIINVSDVEDFYNVEEVEEMRAKAQQFADVCKKYSRIFSYSKLADHVLLLKNMRTTVNNVFSKNFSVNDIKRLVNLVVIWYTNCYNNKLIDKKPVLESTNYYLLALNFIPKTSKRSYYCEFCDDDFNTEHKYYTHRIKHTGDHYPYSCKKCPVGFLRPQPLKSHQSVCVYRREQQTKAPATAADKTQQKGFKVTGKDDNKVSITKMEHKNAVKSEPINREKVGQTQVEVKKLVKTGNASSQPVERRLHTVYKCAKCEMSFATETEVKLHMNSCNRNLRRQPKTYTPRPKPRAEPYSKN